MHHQIEQLQETVERLSRQIAALLGERQQYQGNGADLVSTLEQIVPYPSPRYSSFSSIVEKKRILIDDVIEDRNGYGYIGEEYQPSAELQIQRLTAQLTVAYNRIAALEEQLLACRIHS